MKSMQRKKAIFNILNETLQLTPKVITYDDDSDEFHIDMYIGEDSDDTGFTVCSTIGLSEYPVGLTDGHGRQIRVEFIGMCNSVHDKFADIIASCAFNIIKQNYSCKPGMAALNVIDEYYDGLEMRHIYYTTPSFGDNLREQVIDGKLVKWLMVIPISDGELEYLKKHGADGLESLLEENDTDISDLKRRSIVLTDGLCPDV